MINLYVIRHGSTGAEEQNITLGRIDWPLNQQGFKSAEQASLDFLKKNIRIDAIISSPLERATQTAEIFGRVLKVPVFTDPLLNNRSCGEFEGLTWEEFIASYPNLKKGNSKTVQTNLPSGETIEQVEMRVKSFIDKTKDNYQGKSLIIITHAEIIRILKRMVGGMSKEESRERENENLEVVEFNIS